VARHTNYFSPHVLERHVLAKRRGQIHNQQVLQAPYLDSILSLVAAFRVDLFSLSSPFRDHAPDRVLEDTNFLGVTKVRAAAEGNKSC